jgi:hypothetical protein
VRGQDEYPRLVENPIIGQSVKQLVEEYRPSAEKLRDWKASLVDFAEYVT